MYEYRATENGTFTVGWAECSGTWQPKWTCPSMVLAIDLVVLLNGTGNPVAAEGQGYKHAKIKRLELELSRMTGLRDDSDKRFQEYCRDAQYSAAEKGREILRLQNELKAANDRANTEAGTHVVMASLQAKLQEVTAHRDRLSESNYDLQRKLELTNRLADFSDSGSDAELARAAACEQALIAKNRELLADSIRLRASLKAIAAFATQEAKGVSLEN